MADDPENGFVLLVDEMPLKRAFITQFLKRWASDSNLTVVASSLDDVMALKRPSGCRLVIFSVGAESLADPRVIATHWVLSAAYHEGPMVVLGDRPDTENIEHGLRLGLAGYIPTSLEADLAEAALNFVLAGGCYFPPEALVQIGQPGGAPPNEPRQLPLLSPEMKETSAPRTGHCKSNGTDDTSLARSQSERPQLTPIIVQASDLTSRQQQVLSCLKRARSNKEIARELCMSEATVKVHVRQVMKKLGALNRTHAAVLAVDRVGVDEPVPSNVAPFLSSGATLHHAVRR